MPELEIWALADAHLLQSLNCHLLRITWTPLICTNRYPPRPCKYVLHWTGSHGPIMSSHNYSPKFKDQMVRSKTNNHERDSVLLSIMLGNVHFRLVVLITLCRSTPTHGHVFTLEMDPERHSVYSYGLFWLCPSMKQPHNFSESDVCVTCKLKVTWISTP